MINRAVIAVAALLLMSAFVAADTLTLKDGTVYHGKILKQTKYEVEFEIHRLGGKLKFIKTFDMENVYSLTKGEDVEVKKPQPETKPEAVPETQPTTKPKEKTPKIEIPKTTAKTRPDAGPLETPETLSDSLQTTPRHPSEDKETWDTLTSLQKEEAEKKYQKELEEHKNKNDFRGKTVSWMLVVNDVAKDENGEGFILTSRSEKDSSVTAMVAACEKDYLLKLRKGDKVRVKGIIDDYDFVTPPAKPGELFPERRPPQFNVTLRDASVVLTNDIPLVAMYDRQFESKRTIFLIDSSGSMVDKIDAARIEVTQAVSGLNANQEFAIVFFKNARNPAGIKMTPATDQNKTSAKEQADQVRPAGQSHVLPYLIKAFRTLSTDKEGGIICMVTDGIVNVEEANEIFEAIKKYNPDNRVVINTFLVGQSTEEATEILKAIAELTGGEFSQEENQ